MKHLITLAIVTCAVFAAAIAEAHDRVQFVSGGHCNQQFRVQRFSSRPQFVRQQVVVRDRVQFVDSGRSRRVNQIGLFNFAR